MTVIYMDADITVTAPTNDNQRADLAHWLGGTEPGQVPDTPLNPLICRRSS